ncbi:MAG: tetratricopeptide repeat protein [Terriglobales bacterium]|jgi:tetratricopeptide (TPR) repeat protein
MRIAKVSGFRSSGFLYAVAALCLLAALTGCSRDPNVRKQKYLESGQRYFDKGQYKEAEIQFQNAIQVDARFADAHYKLALAAMRLDQFQTAYQELSKTIEIQPDQYAAHLDMANLLILSRRLPEAREHLDLLVQKQPNNPEVYLARASYDAAANNTAAALADMQKALQLDPARSDSYLSLAMLQMQGQQWDAAEASFKKAVDLNPKSASSLLALGNFYQTRGRFPEAEQMFHRAIDAAHDEPGPRLSLASLYMAENKPAQAEDFLRQAKKDFPSNSVGYRMLGDFYYANNQLDKATDEYAGLYKDHRNDMLVKKNYIQLLILKDRTDEARKLDDEILKEHPDDEDAQIYKGEIEIRSGKASDAINTLQAVLKTDVDSAIAHYQLGLAFDQLANTNRAETEWRDAVRLRPDIIEAHRALAGVAIRHGDPGALAQEADQIIALQPAAPDGYLLRGIAEINRKEYATADEYLHRSLQKEPNNPAAYIQLGNLQMVQSKFAEAQKFYQQALDQDPNSTEALGGVLNVFLIQKQPDRAIAGARAQLAKFPKNTGFHVMHGQLLLEQAKDLPGAEQEFKQAIDLDKKNSEAMVQLGVVQNLRGASDQALQTYSDGSQVNPNEIRFYLLAGGIYESKQDWEHAKQQYQKALTVQRDNPLASNNLAYVMLQQGGNVDVAFQMAQTARQKLPDNPNTADTLGWAFYHKKVYGSAITLFKEALKQQPDNPLFNFHLGLAYAKSNQGAQARQQLDRVMKLKPNFPDVDQLRQALAQVKG